MNPQDEPADISQAQGQPGDDNVSDPAAAAAPAIPPAGGTGQGMMEISLPAGAEDSDLIEKEWVDRAKQIVEHTREDPYEQQRALSEMKADYLKKRYNKDIKLHDS